MKDLFKRLYRFRWAIAFLLSLLIHVLLLGGLEIDIPDLTSDSPVIEAQLSPLPPPVPPPAKPPSKPRSKSKPRQIAGASTAAIPAPPSNEATVGQGNGTAAPAPLPFESGVDLDSSYQFEESVSLPPPKWVETEYEVKRTTFGSGRAKFRYQTNQQHYQIRSEMEATGIATLAFSGKRIESSEGIVTAYGLKPSQYRYEISNKLDRQVQADFDWNNANLTLKNSKETRSYPLEEGAIDVLSFLYQFMFVGPLDVMRYTITNGRTVRQYEYLFVGAETLQTQLGQLNTLHVAKSSGDPDEKTEVWLASDYRYIPVKIIKLAKDGTGYEFLVTRIRADFKDER